MRYPLAISRHWSFEVSFFVAAAHASAACACSRNCLTFSITAHSVAVVGGSADSVLLSVLRSLKRQNAGSALAADHYSTEPTRTRTCCCGADLIFDKTASGKIDPMTGPKRVSSSPSPLPPTIIPVRDSTLLGQVGSLRKSGKLTSAPCTKSLVLTPALRR